MFDKLMENIGLIQKGAALLQQAQNLDADKNGVLDGEQHKQYLGEELSLANALREKLDQHGKLIALDLEALGIAAIVGEVTAPAKEAEVEAPVQPEKKGK